MPTIKITCNDITSKYPYPNTDEGHDAYKAMMECLEDLKQHECNCFIIERLVDKHD